MSEQPKRFGLESQVKRNPHPDFKKVEKSRPEFPSDHKWSFSQTVDPEWKPGNGANNYEWEKHQKIEIDPYADGRSAVDNYKLLISGIVPRPIGFVSTVSKRGVRNLAPFSYTTVVCHDPPIFCIGFSGGKGTYKDTCQNILDTKELTINVISEWFVEAANYTSTDSPLEVDEWKRSGLTPLKSAKVKPEHVAESAFSVEAKLIQSHEWASRTSGAKTGVLCIVEGVHFHAREDVVNEDRNLIDPGKLLPVSRLGGITYGRTVEAYEMPRPSYHTESSTEEVKRILENGTQNSN